jgi:DnaJ-class molecular chaperone
MEVDTSIDYYKVLGAQFGASDDQIKTNFYDLAKKYHPDSSDTLTETMRINNEEQFKRIASAYAILSDERKRQRYDEVWAVKLSKKGTGVTGSANDLNGFQAK